MLTENRKDTMIRKTLLSLFVLSCTLTALTLSGCGKRGNPFCSGCDMDDAPKTYPNSK